MKNALAVILVACHAASPTPPDDKPNDSTDMPMPAQMPLDPPPPMPSGPVVDPAPPQPLQICEFETRPDKCVGTDTFDFGARGVPSSVLIYLHNYSPRPVTHLVDQSTWGPGFRRVPRDLAGSQSCTFVTVLAPGMRCHVQVAFAPSGDLDGISESEIVFAYDSADGPQVARRKVRGSYTSGASLFWDDDLTDSPSAGPVLDFDEHYDTGTGYRLVEAFVYNWGATGAVLATGGVSSADFSMGVTLLAGSTIAPGSFAFGLASFATSGPTAQRAETLSVPYNGGVLSRAMRASRYAEGHLGRPGATWGFYYDYVTGTARRVFVPVFNDGYAPVTGVHDAGGLGEGFAYTGGAYPGTQGTCGDSLAARSACQLDLTFTPTGDAGPKQSAVNLAYDGGGVALAVAGRYQPSAELAVGYVVDADGIIPLDLALANTGTYSDDYGYVMNVGGATGEVSVTFNDDAFSPRLGAFPGRGGTCGDHLAPRQSCRFALRFQPADHLQHAAVMSISGYDVNLQAGWLPPSGMTLYSSSLYFPRSAIPVTGAVVIRNSAGVDLTGMHVTAPSGQFTLTGGTCGATLPASSSCQQDVTFTPQGGAVSSARLLVEGSYGAVAVSGSATLFGYNDTGAQLSLGCADCGQWLLAGTPEVAHIHVSNSGTLGATGLALTLPTGMTRSGGDCGVALGPTGQCDYAVTYDPAFGAVSGDARVTYTEESVTLPVQGTPLAPGPLLRWEPSVTTFDFAGAPSHVFTLRNAGTAAAPVALAEPLLAPFSATTTCGATLASGDSCSFTVNFDPPDAGEYWAFLIVGWSVSIELHGN